MTCLTAGALEVAVAYAVPYGAAAGALLVAGAAVAARRSRRRSAATRHAVWTAAVLAHPLLVVLAAWVPAHGATLPARVAAVTTGWVSARPAVVPGAVVRTLAREGAPESTTRGRTTPGRAAQTTIRGLASGARSVSPGGRAEGRARERAPALAALWLAGALAVLLRPAVGRWRVRRIARAGVLLAGGPWRATADAAAAEFGLRRRVALRRAAGPVVPMTWGVVRPTVLLPADAENADRWPAVRRRAVLAHELAHVRRWDAATQGLADLALAAFWFDPLVWLAVRRMRAERERACDDLALGAGLRPSEYAGELLACARTLASAWPPSRGALAFVRAPTGRPPAERSAARPSEFEARVRAVLDPRQARTPWTRGQSAALAATATAACAALASARPVSPAGSSAGTPRAAAASAAGRPAAGLLAPRTAADREAEPPRPNVSAPSAGSVATGSAAHPVSTSAPNASGPGAPPPVETRSAAILRDAAPLGAAPTAAARVAPAPSLAVDPPAPASEPARDPLPQSNATCDAVTAAMRPGTMWVYADVPGGGRRTEYRQVAPGRCAQVAVVGSVHLDSGDADVATLAPGTAVLVREVVGAPGAGAAGADGTAGDRAVRITAGPDGRPVHAYTVGGRPSAFDAGARAWLAGVAPRLVREAGIDASGRVARWRAEGGVPAVLRGVEGLESDVARRAHYLALVEDAERGGALSPGEAATVARQARRDLTRSPDDVRDLLARLAPP